MFRHIQYRSKLRAHCTPRCTAMLTLIRVCVCWYTHTDIHSHYSLLGRFIWIQHNDQLPVSLLAQLVERCTCIVEVMGSNLVRYRIFFRPYFNYKFGGVHNYEDRFYIRFFNCSAHI